MAVCDAHVFPGFLTPVLTQISFQSHQLLSLHASAEVRGENAPERNSPQLGLELTTTGSCVRQAHHWATQAGPFLYKTDMEVMCTIGLVI